MQPKIYKTILFLALIQFFTFRSHAADEIKWSELRVFISNNTFTTSPTALNSLTAADNVEKLDHLTGVGLEVDGQIKPWLKIGTRIRGIWNAVYPPNPPSPATAYLRISQYSGGMLARIPVVNTDVVLFDIFAELGLGNTKLDIQTISSGNAAFTKNSGFYQRAGASLGLGSAAMKLYIEAGHEWNNLNSMSFEGTLSNTVSSVDFSGPYYAIGLIISGIPSWIKPGGFSTK